MTDIVQGVRIEGDESDYKKAVMASTVALEEFAKKVSTANKKMASDSEASAKKQSVATKAQKGAQESLTKSLVKSQLVTQALGKAYNFLAGTVTTAIADAKEFERTTIALQTALQSSGREVQEHAGFLEVEAGQLQAVTGASDEVIRRMQTQAVAFGVSTTKTRELIEASFGLANATGMDVNTAFIQLQKSTTGVIEETLKMIPGMRGLTKEQLAAGDAIRIANERFGEFADLETRGLSGQVTTLKNAWADLGEAVAKAAMQQGTFLNRATEGWSAWLTSVASVIEDRGFGEFVTMDFEDLANAAYEIEREKARILAEQREKVADEEETRAAAQQASAAAAQARVRSGRGGGEPRAIRLSAISTESGMGGGGGVQESFIGQRLAITAQANEAENRMREEQHTHRMQMESQQQQEILDQKRAAQEAEFEMVSTAAMMTTQAALGALGAWANGSKVAADEIAVGLIKGVGRTLFARGMSDFLGGVANNLWFPGSGAGLMAIGAKEMAIGGAMYAGGLVMNRAGVGGGGGGGGRATSTGGGTGGGASSFPGDMGGGGAAADRGPTQLTVVFNGPTTKAEVGIAIKDAVREAEARGF